MTNTIEFSIIVPAYNAAATLPHCLAALRQQTVDRNRYEIIVIDDGSQDNTAQLVEAGDAQLIQQSNKGQAAARNVGILRAKGPIICFTDADCTPAPDWLEELTRPLCTNPDISGSKGIYRTQQKAFTARFVQVEYEEKYDRLKHYSRISFIDTYSAAYRREALLAVGCFDERFPIAEDRELSYRLAAHGYQMVFQPTAVVSHIHAHTLWDYFRKKVLNGYWVGQTMRHFPDKQWEDTYTPQTMKVQVGLIALILLAAFFSLFWAVSRLVLLVLVLLFGLTTLPFVRTTWPKDTAVAILAPFFLALRALALGFGYLGRFVWTVDKQEFSPITPDNE
jgi:glycosyltransferase involved in cell wall biosynthesis